MAIYRASPVIFLSFDTADECRTLLTMPIASECSCYNKVCETNFSVAVVEAHLCSSPCRLLLTSALHSPAAAADLFERRRSYFVPHPSSSFTAHVIDS